MHIQWPCLVHVAEIQADLVVRYPVNQLELIVNAGETLLIYDRTWSVSSVDFAIQYD